MPVLFQCSRGHAWEDVCDDGPSPWVGQLVCPVCGLIPADDVVPAPAVRAMDQRLPRTVETPPPGLPAADINIEDRPTILDAQAKPRPKTPLPTLPGYEVLGELGRGGMGVVYKARQLGLNRLVALKMVLGGAQAGERQLARFRDEAEAVARLAHPNIVQIYEVGEQAGLPYFSLEYVEGGTLAEHLLQETISPRASAELIEKLARAAHSAHERGIVHRDLKPANILLATCDSAHEPAAKPQAEGFVPKIADFGLAKLLDRDEVHTWSGVVVGTPQYMAPEQARGNRDAIGPATDVYALGSILYELLAGRPPFDGDTAINILMRVAREEPEPIRRYRPKTARDLEIICLKCLHKQPHRRYESAAALADDLRRFLNHEPILARPVSTRERCVQWVRRHPAWAGLAAGLLLAVAALGVFQIRNLHNIRQNRESQRADARQLLVKAETTAAEGKYNRAREHLDRLAPYLTSSDIADEWRSSADRLTREVDGRLIARATYARFLTLHDAALFYAAPGNYRAAAENARAALLLVGLPGDTGWQHHEFFTDEQANAVTRGCLELLLVVAEAEVASDPSEAADRSALRALPVLDRAKPLGLRTRAFHIRRAVYLQRAGDAGWQSEQALADACPIESAFDLFLIGQGQLARHQVEEARTSFAAALRKQPADFWAWYYQALCYVRLEQMGLARESLTAALSHKPNVVWPYLLRGFASSNLNDYAAAEDDFDAALRLLQERPDPDARYVLLNNRAVVRLGLLARKRSQANMPEAQRRVEMRQLFDLAMTDLREAMELKPEQYHAFATSGQAFADLGDLTSAVAQINQAIDLAAKHSAGSDKLALLHRNRARWEEATQDVASALSSLRSAVELERDDTRKAKALAETGHLNVRARQFVQAVAAYDEALRLNPNQTNVRTLRAECLLKRERWADAAQAFDEILRTGTGTQSKILAGRALARMKLEPPDRIGAVADLTNALAVEPTNAAYRGQRGQLYLALEQYPAALADFDEILANDRNAAALLGRGLARVRLGYYKSAAADADEAREMKAATPLQQYTAGSVFALAAGCLDALNRPLTREEAALRSDYQAQALAQVRRALLALPPEERVRFWVSHPARDRALASVRSTAAFRQLQHEFAPA